MHTNFCGRCGAQVQGVFCTQCGSSTSAREAAVHRGATAPPVMAATPGTTPLPVHQREAAEAPNIPSVVLGEERQWLKWETIALEGAFLVPLVLSAVVLFAQHLSGVGGITRFPDLVHNQVANLVLGILAYTSVVVMVPLALLLLARTGQSPRVLGLGAPRLRLDLLPGLGIAAASFGCEILILIPLAPLIASHRSLISNVPVGHVPGYYVIWGIAISAMTALAEEVLMNGYLLTRLDQLGWTPAASVVLAVALRTSYHVYYGVGFLLTIPFSYFATRSFQKNRRLTRPITAHFVFDAALLTISILH